MNKTKLKDTFLSLLKSKDYTFTNVNNIQQEALEAIASLDFPTSEDEYWKYTRLQPILEKKYNVAPACLSTIDTFPLKSKNVITLVFINGFFSEQLSDIIDDSQIIVASFRNALSKHIKNIENNYAQYADYKTQLFTAINTAYWQDGAFIYIHDKIILQRAIQIIHLTVGENRFIQPRNLIVLGKGSQVQISQFYQTTNKGSAFTNEVTEIVLKEEAKIKYSLIQDENEFSSQITTTQVHQYQNSHFTSHTITLGGEVVRNNLNVVVDGERCETFLYGLYMLNNGQHVDNHTFVNHKKPNCISNEKYKGIICKKSKGVFNGRVLVEQEAQKINAFQSNQNIVLSDDAKMYSKPELEIYADDVKCSHGSTTGQLDDEAIFYLRSRGVSEQSAKTLLLKSFAGEIADTIGLTSLKEKVEKSIENNNTFR